MNTDITIPPEASADGKRNAFYNHCRVVGHSRPYAVCLHLCTERKDGRLETSYAECSAAIGKKECPALGMRKEEKTAGHAIYFTERVRSVAGIVEAGIALVKQTIVAIKPTEPPPRVFSGIPDGIHPAPKKTHTRNVLDMIPDADYGKAISRAVEKEVKPTAIPPSVEPVAGESLLEMARRLMGK